MGCGACATVCPSGAMSYAYPSVPDLGLRLRTLLVDLCEGRRSRRLHPAPRGGWTRRDREPRAARPRASGACHPVRSASRRVRSDSTSGSAPLAHGASQVAVLADRRRGAAVSRSAGTADAHRRHDRPGAGLPGRAFPGGRRRRSERPGRGAVVVAGRADRPRRRRLSRSPPTSARRRRSRSITSRGMRRCRSGRSRSRRALRSAPSWSTATRCTMCLACVGACPEGAILDNQEAPQLFVHRDRSACSAASARRRAPRTPSRSRHGCPCVPEARQPRVINEAVVVNCSACGKPLGTEKMVSGHAGEARRPFDVRGARRARPAARCAPTAA